MVKEIGYFTPIERVAIKRAKELKAEQFPNLTRISLTEEELHGTLKSIVKVGDSIDASSRID